VLDSSAQ